MICDWTWYRPVLSWVLIKYRPPGGSQDGRCWITRNCVNLHNYCRIVQNPSCYSYHPFIENTRTLQNRHFEKVLACMVLKLTVYVRNVICQKSGEIPIFETFLAKCSDFDYVSSCLLKIGSCFMTLLWRHTLDVCTYIGMFWKRRPIAILWYPLAGPIRRIWGFCFQNHPPPPVNRVTEKGLVRRGLMLLAYTDYDQ